MFTEGFHVGKNFKNSYKMTKMEDLFIYSVGNSPVRNNGPNYDDTKRGKFGSAVGQGGGSGNIIPYRYTGRYWKTNFI